MRKISKSEMELVNNYKTDCQYAGNLAERNSLKRVDQHFKNGPLSLLSSTNSGPL
jgi:hypothetical protein